MAEDQSRYVGIIEIKITPPYVREDGMLVSEGGEIEVRNVGDQTDEDLLEYAAAALAERRGARPLTVTEEQARTRRIESWPWEQYVFPLGQRVRPREGGPEGRVVHHGVDGVLVEGDEDSYGFWDPWELVPARP